VLLMHVVAFVQGLELNATKWSLDACAYRITIRKKWIGMRLTAASDRVAEQAS
jgi:hypothetical protein